MGVLTLGTIAWANDPHGVEYARTMGFTAFALSHVFFAVATKDERRSIFDLDTFADRPLRISVLAALGVIVLTTTLEPLQRLLETTTLSVADWLVCLGAASSVVVVSELRKLIMHKPIDEQVAAKGDS
jgi:Ca2+-transporting ATPase